MLHDTHGGQHNLLAHLYYEFHEYDLDTHPFHHDQNLYLVERACLSAMSVRVTKYQEHRVELTFQVASSLQEALPSPACREVAVEPNVNSGIVTSTVEDCRELSGDNRRFSLRSLREILCGRHPDFKLKIYTKVLDEPESLFNRLMAFQPDYD